MGPFFPGDAFCRKESLLWFTLYLQKFHLSSLLPFLKHLIVNQLPSQKFLGLFVFHLSICSPQPRKSLWMRLLLRNYNRNLAANAWSQGTGPKGKQTLHLVQLSGVLEKHNPGDFFIMPLSYVRDNCTSERALSELPNQKTTQVSSSISLVLGQKDRSHHEENTGCLKPFTEHSGDVTRVGPIYHIATKNSCPQTISTSSCLQVGVEKPFSEET